MTVKVGGVGVWVVAHLAPVAVSLLQAVAADANGSRVTVLLLVVPFVLALDRASGRTAATASGIGLTAAGRGLLSSRGGIEGCQFGSVGQIGWIAGLV